MPKVKPLSSSEQIAVVKEIIRLSSVYKTAALLARLHGLGFRIARTVSRA